MTAPEFSVVVPLLDEQSTVDELVGRLTATLDGLAFELVFVDDGSRDGTARALRAHELSDERVRVVELTRRFGQMSALVCGLEHARGRILVTMDGDLQDPPEEIPALLAGLADGVEIACAVRGERHQEPWRRLGGNIVHVVARRLTGVELQDFGGQFRAYRREVVDATLAIWSEGRPFFPLALWAGFRVGEVPVRHDPRRDGPSRYTLVQLLLLNLDLITSFTTAPLLWMFSAGAVLMATGALLLVAGGLPSGGAGLLVVLGAVFAASGLVGLYLARVYRLVSGGRRLHVVRRSPLRDEAHSPVERV